MSGMYLTKYVLSEKKYEPCHKTNDDISDYYFVWIKRCNLFANYKGASSLKIIFVVSIPCINK